MSGWADQRGLRQRSCWVASLRTCPRVCLPRELTDTRGGHAEQQARRGALAAREMPGEGEHGLGELRRGRHGEERRVRARVSVLHLARVLRAPVLRIGEAGIEEQIKTAGGTRAPGRIERDPSAREFRQQHTRRCRPRLLREQLEALPVQLAQGGKRRAAQPALVCFSARIFHLALQHHDTPPGKTRAAMVAAGAENAIHGFGDF